MARGQGDRPRGRLLEPLLRDRVRNAKVEREGEHLADLGAGDVFGEQGLLEHSERSATVTSTSDIKLIKIEHWELSRMKKAMPEAYQELVAKVEERKAD